MARFPRPIRLERQQYAHGQLLRSRDIGDMLSDAAQLRWWHNRAIHNAFGVVAGFSVTIDDGATTATIGPGLLFDAFGRELLLRAPLRIALPAETGDWTLVAAYPDERGTLCYPEAPCWPAGPEERGIAPAIRWRPSREVRLGEEVPLHRLRPEVAVSLASAPAGLETLGAIYDADRKILRWRGVMAAVQRAALLSRSADQAYQAAIRQLYALSRGIGASAKRAARPLARPRIGSGTVFAMNRWQPWLHQAAPGERFAGLPIGVEARIETAAVGFATTPCYFAWLEWPGAPVSTDSDEPMNLVLGHTFVAEPTPDGFLFRAPIPPRSLRAITRISNRRPIEDLYAELALDAVAIARAIPLTICWIGIEMEPAAAA